MAAKKSSPKERGKVKKVMHEHKHGQLKSGGKKKVKSRKQAVAIALSEARRSGAKVLNDYRLKPVELGSD